MKFSFLFCLLLLVAGIAFCQNTLDKAGLTSATPAQVAFSLRNMSTAYTGFAIKVRRSSDNAEANLAFDASGNTTAASMATFTPGVTVGVSLGTAQTGTISSSVARTGTISIAVNKPGTITVSNGSATVTGVGTSFTTDVVVGSLLFNATNSFLGVVSSITSNTVLLLNNFATVNLGAVAYKTSSAVVTGTGSNFTGELTVGDRIFNTTNIYLGTVASISSATSMTLNAVDATVATASAFKGSTAVITGVGTSFTSLNPGDLVVSNNVTLGIISSVTSATSLTLVTKAGSAVSGLAYKSTTGTIAFSSFYSGTSVYLNTWYDQSGFNRNATQLKAANQALIVNAGTLYIVNSRTSVQFSNALASFVETSTVASYLNNSLYTLNKVTAEATINPVLQLPISTTGGNGPTNTISHYGYRSSSQFTVAQYGNDQNFNATPSTTLELHTSVKISTASSQFYKNGISLGILSSGSPSNLTNIGLLNIGFYMPTVSYYNGSISELTVFSTALGATDIALLDNNQLAYYNIATTFWTGAVSTAWTDPGNWSTGIVPTITDPAIVVIPAGKPNYPVISTVAPANSISLEAATTLTITGTLQLAGTLNSLGTCTASSGTVQFVGAAPQSITNGSYAGNIIQNMIVNNSMGVALASAFSVTGTLTFASGFLSLGGFTLTLGGNIVNTVTGGLRGSTSSNLVVTGAFSRALSFDQSTIGTTNILNNLTINSAGQIISLSNNLILNGTGTLTFTAGKLAIGTSTLTMRGLVVNTVTDGLRGSASSNAIIDGAVSPTLSFDQTTSGTTNLLASLTLNCTTQTVSLSRSLVIGTALTITTGTLADAGNQITSSGTLNLVSGTLKLGSASVATIWPSFSTNTISTTGTVEYCAGVSQSVSGVPVYQNLSISAAGGTIAAADLTVNNVLNLSAANPSATLGSLSMGSFTLLMGSLGTTIGAGDVTGIIKRTTILPNVSYSMGNQYVSITFPAVGTLPSQMSIQTAIGVAPTWKTGTVLRTYDFIQTGGSGTQAVITAHYLDAELNGNTESNLVDFSFRFSGSILTEHGKSNFNTTQNWITLSNVNVAFFASTFGNVQLSFAQSTLTTLTWNGSTSTSWITATNWTPNGGPSTNTNLIIPDAATTPNSPTLPATASNGSLTIQTGGIVNSSAGAQLTLNNPGLAWSNSGTFNAGTSTILFATAGGTMNGTTNFNNITINSGASLQMGTGNIMRIGGLMTNSGTWNTGLLTNTVEYNGSSQTILIPNGSPSSYYNLIVSGSGTNILPAATLNLFGDLTLNATVSTTGSTVSMNGSISQNINGTAALTLNNLTINNTSAAVNMNQHINVAGALAFSAGKLALLSNTLTLSGTVVNTVANGITGGLSSNLVLNGTVSPTISFDQTVPGASNVLNNLTINSSGQTVTLGSNLSIEGNLSFTAGKLSIGANTLEIDNALTNTVTGGIRGGGTSNLIVGGALTSPSLSFDQTVTGTSNLLNNFTINSTGQSAMLSNPLVVGGSLNLMDGWIQTTAANSLTMNAAAVFTGGATNTFVNGPLIRNTASTATYQYPLGKGTNYQPLSISPSTASAGTYSAEFYPAIAPAGSISPALTAIATDEYWNVGLTSGPDAIVTLNYEANNSWSLASPSASDFVVVAGLVAGIWTPENGDVTTGTVVSPLKNKLQSNFSSFTFAYGQSTALPLKLLSFTGKQAVRAVNLNWITAGAYNVSHFEIERAANGSPFIIAGELSATNGSADEFYRWTDYSPFNGINDYRLKMIDIDEVVSYSNIVRIDVAASRNSISVYPNPVNGHSIHLSMTGQPSGLYTVNLFNATGEKLMSESVMHESSRLIETLSDVPTLRNGVYYLDITDTQQKKTTVKLLFAQ